jgi:hypothetical protein
MDAGTEATGSSPYGGAVKATEEPATTVLASAATALTGAGGEAGHAREASAILLRTCPAARSLPGWRGASCGDAAGHAVLRCHQDRPTWADLRHQSRLVH